MSKPDTQTTDLPYGTRLKDNDPRMPMRAIHEVRSVHSNGQVFICPSGGSRNQWFSILRTRIHTDGKPRRSGWNVIND